MNLMLQLWRSSLGKKYLVAMTGLGLIGFVVGHLVGNLQIFLEPDAINSYAHFLKSKPGLLWSARLGLLACVGLHLVTVITLTTQNRAARPVGYETARPYGADTRSRTMIWSGLVILAFVIYHLLHFTALMPGINGLGDFRKLTTQLQGEIVPDVYAMMLMGFSVWWVAFFYLLAQALLFMHLSHGISSMFQSLGLRNHTWWPRILFLAKGVSLALFIGYSSIPVAIQLGLGRDYLKKAGQSIATASIPAEKGMGH